jgi:DNA polymerase bacteriophage-type
MRNQPDVLWLDLETRSRCDLLKRGTYNYAQDETTQILIACYALNHGPIMQWRRWKAEPMPDDLTRLLADKRVEIRAHSPFERLVMKLPLERYVDTAAQMRALAIPGGLDAAARFLGLRAQKDPEGARLIRLLSMPQKDGNFLNDPLLLERFTAYCTQDVEVMRQLSLGTQQMDADTLALYRANEVINDRGIPIDRELCALATGYAEEARAEAAEIVERLTDGEATSANGEKAKLWVYDRLPEQAQALMRVPVYKTDAENVNPTKGRYRRNSRTKLPGIEGEWSLTLDKDTREAITLLAEDNPDLFNEDVMAVIDAREAAAPSSASKFLTMRSMCSPDGRLRGSFVLNGAGQTGRFSAMNAQIHNLARSCQKDPEAVLAVMRKHGALAPFGSTLTVLKGMTRAAVFAGHDRRIVRTDWSAVEARGLPWLADSREADAYLAAFRDPKRDIYLEQARAVGLGENRQAGKVLVLALGYGGGIGALAAMAKSYGVVFTTPGPTIVARWRAANQWAVKFWSDLDRAARQALIAKGSIRRAGRLTFEYIVEPNFEALTMTLPSKRKLFYPFARLEPNEKGGSDISYMKSAWRPKAHKAGEPPNEWPRARLWGGLLCENATQACCADLLRLVVAQCAPDLIGHVHDECISEVSQARAKSCARDQEKRMLALPAWATGFPLAVESDIAERFRK